MKTRVSLTIDKNVLANIDKMVDHISIKSRSEAVEKILRDHSTNRRTAVILLGGNPDKLYSKDLGCYRPLAPVGKSTLIEDTISKCREAGFSTIVIVGFPLVIAKLYEVLGNGEKYNTKVIYVEEKRSRGSAKSLELASNYLGSDFLFLSGTFYIGFDLRKLADFHKAHDGTVTIGVHSRTNYSWDKSVVEMDGYKIVEFEENPKTPKTRLVGVLAGFMKTDVFNMIPPGDVDWSLQENVFPKLAREGKLVGYPLPGDWLNVHDSSDLKTIGELRKRQK